MVQICGLPNLPNLVRKLIKILSTYKSSDARPYQLEQLVKIKTSKLTTFSIQIKYPYGVRIYDPKTYEEIILTFLVEEI